MDDCVDAILWISHHAPEYDIDKSRIALSGFSAGGNLALAAALRLHEIQKGTTAAETKLAGIVAFNPSVNWTQTRAERPASNAISEIKAFIPPSLYKLYDDSYLYPKPLDMSSPYLSPGLAADELLIKALPEKIMLYSCGWDMLLVEVETFRKRLSNLGKVVGGMKMPEVAHTWDKIRRERRYTRTLSRS
ncbi:hypothetical protein MMC06_003395 [Schaereria dolodes]|nr:hypothetical protein [Schaereria dolodes]